MTMALPEPSRDILNWIRHTQRLQSLLDEMEIKFLLLEKTRGLGSINGNKQIDEAIQAVKAERRAVRGQLDYEMRVIKQLLRDKNYDEITEEEK